MTLDFSEQIERAATSKLASEQRWLARRKQELEDLLDGEAAADEIEEAERRLYSQERSVIRLLALAGTA